jgi:predicted glutamine amidotransferase
VLTQVLYTPVHSLIDQSLHSRLGAETTNGDGFGAGWYDAAPARVGGLGEPNRFLVGRRGRFS